MGLPASAAALTAQRQASFAAQLAARDAANIYVQVYVLGDPIPTLWPRRDLVF